MNCIMKFFFGVWILMIFWGVDKIHEVSLFVLSCVAYRFSWMAPAMTSWTRWMWRCFRGCGMECMECVDVFYRAMRDPSEIRGWKITKWCCNSGQNPAQLCWETRCAVASFQGMSWQWVAKATVQGKVLEMEYIVRCQPWHDFHSWTCIWIIFGSCDMWHRELIWQHIWHEILFSSSKLHTAFRFLEVKPPIRMPEVKSAEVRGQWDGKVETKHISHSFPIISSWIGSSFVRCLDEPCHKASSALASKWGP